MGPCLALKWMKRCAEMGERIAGEIKLLANGELGGEGSGSEIYVFNSDAGETIRIFKCSNVIFLYSYR